jgi:transposase
MSSFVQAACTNGFSLRDALQKRSAKDRDIMRGGVNCWALVGAMKQLTLATVGFERYAKTTRRAAFLDEMDRVVPWSALCALIEPFYPKPGNGRPPVGVERMLRIYFLQHWFNLSDPAVEEALYDSQAMRRFVGIDLGREPDETTVCRFRHRLEEHDLGRRLFVEVQQHLAAKGLKGRHWHDCRCDHHQCAIFDQECRQGA